jgi:hypothetical protein
MSNIDYKKLLADIGLRGMSVEEFARVIALDGIRFASKPRLNEAFRDSKPNPLRDDVAMQVLALWREIEAIALEVYSHAPWAVMDLSDGNRVHASLEIFRGCQVLKGTNSSDQQ